VKQLLNGRISGDYTKINMAIDEIIVLTKPIEK